MVKYNLDKSEQVSSSKYYEKPLFIILFYVLLLLFLALIVFIIVHILPNLLEKTFDNLKNKTNNLELKRDLLPKTNYTCDEIIPQEIIIGDEGGYLTTINTDFKNGINIDAGEQNCQRSTEVGSNIHNFGCVARFYVIDRLDPDGTITKNSYLVSYNLFFDDRNCTNLDVGGNYFGHPNAKTLSCTNFSYKCSWKYYESTSVWDPIYSRISISINDLNKTI